MESYSFVTSAWWETQQQLVRNVLRKPRWPRWPLAVTMALESVLVIYLTVRDFGLGGTLTATIGSVTLLAISAIGVWATYATCVQHGSWRGASLLGQFSIAVLAGYTVLTDVQSPFPRFFVAGIAGILGIIAISGSSIYSGWP